MFRGWRDTISAPLTTKASRLPTRDTAAMACDGVAPAVACAIRRDQDSDHDDADGRDRPHEAGTCRRWTAGHVRHPAPPRSHRPRLAGFTASSMVSSRSIATALISTSTRIRSANAADVPLGIEPRPVEPPVDEPLDALPERLEERERGDRRARDRKRRVPGESSEPGLEHQHARREDGQQHGGDDGP